ncbi:MAG TPA: hypothetical protein VIW68_13490 [Candidatus Sulfotelmatobacter sp.]
MKPSILVILATPLVLLLFTAAQTRPVTSETELQFGIDAYKNAHYEEAIYHFEKSVDLDGTNLQARLYLATACTSQYIPGVETPDNLQYAEKAIVQYQHIVDSDANPQQKINSAKGIAYLDLNMKKFDDAKKFYQMASELDPDDPEPYYSIGVIDWTATYGPRMEARAKLGVKPEDHLDTYDPDQRKVCEELSVENKPVIDEGITDLNKAIQLRPDYDDAMAYMNLMYREKADVECDNLSAREEDLQTADQWVDKAMAVKKARAEKPPPQRQQPVTIVR